MIAFLAGPNDQFRFIRPLMDHLAAQGREVRCFPSREVAELGLANILDLAELAWFEWGNGYVVEASRLPRRCPIVVRVHRYEVYQERMRLVNWAHVDEAVFVNPVFVDVYNGQAGLELRELTRVTALPNPVSESFPFATRGPGFKLAAVSRFHPDKNPALLLQVLAALARRDPRYTLHMVGGVQDVQLYHYCLGFAREAGLEANFFHEGSVDDVPAWLADKHAVLATSIVESQGLGVMEAMMMGIKPVVHAGFGDQAAVYGPEHVFRTVDEAVAMILSPQYDSHAYRERIVSRYGASHILPLLADVALRHLPDAKTAKDDARRRSLLNLARHYRGRGNEAKYRECLAHLETIR